MANSDHLLHEKWTGHEAEFDMCDIVGVRCICLKFSSTIDETKSKTAEQRRRRRIKEAIGNKYMDVPLLDSKQKDNDAGKEFCDIIIFSQHLDMWEKTLCSHYSQIGYKQEDKVTLPQSGYQLVWSSDETPEIHVSFWPKSSKLMIQPGQRNEEKILEWLNDFPHLESKCYLGLMVVTGVKEAMIWRC